MKLDLLPPDSWENFQSALLDKLKLPSGTEGLRVYRGVGHALFEAVVSLSQLYPHKRSLVVVEGLSPYLEAQLKHFSKEGYDIVRMSPMDLSAETCQSKVTKDCLLVLCCEDHAVTAELLDFSGLESAATAQRAFCLRLSHTAWRRQEQSALGKYTLQIRSVSPDLAFICHGARFKASPLIAQQMYWPKALLVEAVTLGQEPLNEAKKAIQKFEASLPLGVAPYFTSEQTRIFDRSVLVLTDMSADALAEELAEQLGIELPAPPERSYIDTPNQCRWGELRWQDWWTHGTPKEEEYRGLLVLDQELVLRKEFAETFEQSIQAIRKLQVIAT